MGMITAKLDEPDLAAKADDMGPAELDQLPFGVLKLDGAGRVVRYNRVEEEIASIDCNDEISYNPFTDIAPCIDNPFFRGRFERGIAEGSLAIDFEVETDIGPRAERIRVRMLSARDPNTCWIFIKRL